MRAARVEFQAPPTVLRFLQSEAFVRAIVGPIGSGKSSGCVLEILRRAAQQKKLKDGKRRTRFAVIRNTRPQLQDTTRKTFEQWVPDRMGTWNESEFTFTIRAKDLEAEVLFRALDKPKDVRKVLSLELTGAYINELREIPKEVFDGLQGRVGRYPSRADGGCTWRGLWGDTNPWHTGHWGFRIFSKERPPGFELFEQPDALSPEAENVSNLDEGYYQRIVHGKDSEWVDEYVRGRYPKADRGSVYGQLVHELEARGGVSAFEHPADGVYLNADLGISDSTALWWWRLNGDGGVDFVDHYEAHGKPLSHFFSIIRERGWGLKKVWLPHDARARTLATGRSIQDQFNDEYGSANVAIGPPLSVEDGIGALRWLLENPATRVHSRCSAITGDSDIDGLEALRSYRYEYDETKKVYKKTPLHDWSSHSSDSARYVACVATVTQRLSRKPDEALKRPKVEMSSNLVAIDGTDILEARAGPAFKRRRI